MSPEKAKAKHVMQVHGLKCSLPRLKILSTIIHLSTICAEHETTLMQIHGHLQATNEPISLTSLRQIMARLHKCGAVVATRSRSYRIAWI
ncbi:hypothetical protein [Pseudomonas sp. LRF_L74]|uniref:hypothetical protein n=1 Tax=Pseudomonas sp. LRF_L74 TaxID=3369422 RepID=UPI003F62FE0C